MPNSVEENREDELARLRRLLESGISLTAGEAAFLRHANARAIQALARILEPS